jgi:hypothetical protein
MIYFGFVFNALARNLWVQDGKTPGGLPGCKETNGGSAADDGSMPD